MHDATSDPTRWKEERWSLFKEPTVNSYRRFMSALKGHPKTTIVVSLLVLTIIFAERPYYQPFFPIITIYAPGLLLVLGIAYGLWRVLKRYSARYQALGGAIVFSTAVVLVLWGPGWHDYLAYYLRYGELRHEIVDLHKGQFYRTADDRSLPLEGVDGLIRDHVNDNELSSSPDFVRVGDTHGWTADIGPNYWWGQVTHDITEIIFINSTATSPDFSRRTPIVNSDGSKINFNIGENLRYSRNIENCVRRSFGPWRMLRYQPGNILRVKDDSGRWVYAVSLVRWSWNWSGFFPWPESGGVQIVPQDGPYSKPYEWAVVWPKHDFLGCGYWIPPEEVQKHAFLRGQNIVPYEASRFMAESNKFQAGFLGPTRFSRQGEVRIADSPEDLNLQPYVLKALPISGGNWKLYQWFGLQPYDKDKCGLAISFLVPADGIGLKYRYNHAANKEAPIGPSCVADKVRARQSEAYWANRKPAEPIPYVHDIADSNGNVAPRFTYKPVIVTQKVRKEGEPPQFIPGTPPDTWIVDAYRGFPVQVGSDPKKWDEQLREELGSVWAEKP